MDIQTDWVEREELNQDIILLHDIARRLERNLGKGTITEDLRKIADRVNELTKTL